MQILRFLPLAAARRRAECVRNASCLFWTGAPLGAPEAHERTSPDVDPASCMAGMAGRPAAPWEA